MSSRMSAEASLPDRERQALGRRWLLGIVSLFLGALVAFAVLCLHFPELLTTPELRAVYPMTLVRALIAGGIAAAAGLGALAVALRRGRRLGVLGLALALGAQLAGGAWVEVATPVARGSHIGLDWLALDLLLLAIVFVPLERATGVATSTQAPPVSCAPSASARPSAPSRRPRSSATASAPRPAAATRPPAISARTSFIG